jgi:hypothetical protein
MCVMRVAGVHVCSGVAADCNAGACILFAACYRTVQFNLVALAPVLTSGSS